MTVNVAPIVAHHSWWLGVIGNCPLMSCRSKERPAREKRYFLGVRMNQEGQGSRCCRPVLIGVLYHCASPTAVIIEENSHRFSNHQVCDPKTEQLSCRNRCDCARRPSRSFVYEFTHTFPDNQHQKGDNIFCFPIADTPLRLFLCIYPLSRYLFPPHIIAIRTRT